MNIHRKYKVILILSVVLTVFPLRAQQIISLHDAMEQALKFNYDILLASTQSELAKENNTAGNSGMLPTIQLTGTGTITDNNSKIVQSTGAEKNYTGMITKTFSGGIQLDWTLFDGGKMFITKRKLSELELQGQSNFRVQVMQTVYDVTESYFDVVRQKQQLKALQEVDRYNSEQVKIAEAGFKAGTLIKPDLLQAKMDLNITSENIISQQYNIVTALKRLKLLLGKSERDNFDVVDTISVQYNPDKESLMQKIASHNPSLQALKHQIEAAELAIKECKSEYLPNLSLRAGYYASLTENPASFTTSNRAVGPQISGTLAVPLYSAGELKRKTAVSRIEADAARYNYQSMQLELQVSLENILTEFQNQLYLLKIETENNELARENMDISIARLRLGQTTSLEVHQAREYFVQSSTRLTNFRYNLKIAETKLRQLSADL